MEQREIDLELVDVIEQALNEKLMEMTKASKATDFEMQLALKNLASKKENEVAMKMQAAVMFGALSKIGK